MSRSGPRLHQALPLAVTMGDPSGIGPDVLLAAWVRRQDLNLPPFHVLADPAFLARRAALLGLAVPIRTVDPGATVATFAEALPVVELRQAVAGVPGAPSAGAAGAIIGSIESAVGQVRTGAASAVVTLPIAKSVLYDAGFTHPGHTEFLGELALAWGHGPEEGRYRPVMMLAGPDLSTVPVTVHIALSEVPKRLTRALIVATGRIVAADLVTRFGLSTPRLAVAGLNPHAGEAGSMGREDLDIVAPAVEELRALGINAFGPLPSDTMFQPRARAGFDAALCMYHDQALIPVKTIAFDETVNVTLGLPFVRTSPDHGTAFDIAGTGKARAESLIEAIRLADRMARQSAGLGDR